MHEELIAHPLTIWVAPVGTAFPDPGAEPAAEWKRLGASGDKSYTDDGVTLALSQSIETFTGAGGTLPRKAFRTEEGVVVGVNVADVRMDVLKLALNDNEDTEALGVVTMSLHRGTTVATHALLARGVSPEDPTKGAFFQVPLCYVDGEPEIVWNKGEPASVELDFTALEPDDLTDFLWGYEKAGA